MAPGLVRATATPLSNSRRAKRGEAAATAVQRRKCRRVKSQPGTGASSGTALRPVSGEWRLRRDLRAGFEHAAGGLTGVAPAGQRTKRRHGAFSRGLLRPAPRDLTHAAPVESARRPLKIGRAHV